MGQDARLPWDELAEAESRLEESRRRAGLAASDAERELAEQDAAVEAGRVEFLRWKLAWLLPLLLAETLASEDARLWVGRLVGRLDDGRLATLADQVERLAEWVEWASPELGRLRRENWELARELARLGREVNAVRYELERSQHGDHGPGPEVCGDRA